MIPPWKREMPLPLNRWDPSILGKPVHKELRQRSQSVDRHEIARRYIVQNLAVRSKFVVTCPVDKGNREPRKERKPIALVCHIDWLASPPQHPRKLLFRLEGKKAGETIHYRPGEVGPQYRSVLERSAVDPGPHDSYRSSNVL